MTKKLFDLSGNYTYRCLSCDLVFLPEEIPERYIKNRRTCVRCLVNDKVRRGELILPPCYGKKYDGLEEACVRFCTLRGGCIVEAVDAVSNRWVIERQYLSYKNQKKQGRRFRFVHHVARILRAAGRPLHVDDIGPIIAFNNGGEAEFRKNRKSWGVKVTVALNNCSAAVALGSNFYIWAGIWDLKDGGVIKREPKEKLLSIEEIFKDL